MAVSEPNKTRALSIILLFDQSPTSTHNHQKCVQQGLTRQAQAMEPRLHQLEASVAAFSDTGDMRDIAICVDASTSRGRGRSKRDKRGGRGDSRGRGAGRGQGKGKSKGNSKKSGEPNATATAQATGASKNAGGKANRGNNNRKKPRVTNDGKQANLKEKRGPGA